MGKDLTEGAIMRALDFAYDKAVNGVVGMDSASEIAESYMKVGGSKVDQANSLIRWQNTKAGTSGFLTGIGGIIVYPGKYCKCYVCSDPYDRCNCSSWRARLEG